MTVLSTASTMSQPPLSRKRPAPGASPLPAQPVPVVPTYPTVDATGQVAHDAFVPWGASVQPPVTTAVGLPPMPTQPASMAMPLDVHPYDLTSLSAQTAAAATTDPMSGQLTRRPGSQMVPRTSIDSNPSYMHSPTSFGEQDALRYAQDDAKNEDEDDDAAVEQRALLAKKEAQDKRRQIPPFVQKLMSFLNDEKNTPYIRWSDDGNSFIVVDEDEFARTLIPEMFKHNKYPSFVRQLNMYGFHKKVRLSDNSMRAHERKNKSPSEYANPYFKRGRPDLLWLIQKPKGSQSGKSGSKSGSRMKSEDREDVDHDEVGDDAISAEGRSRFRGQLALGGTEGVLAQEQLSNVYRELQTIRQQQQIISNTINKIRREHDQLYSQAATFQEQHTRHENSINAILTFLATVYNRSLQGGADGVQSLMNSFQNAVPQEQLRQPVNIVDMDLVNSDGVEPKRAKRTPLLLKGAPEGDSLGRVGSANGSPQMSSNGAQYSHGRDASSGPSHNSVGPNVEELFDASPQASGAVEQQRRQRSIAASSVTPPASAGNGDSLPQRDIMSMVQTTNNNERTATDDGVSAARFSEMISPFSNNNTAANVVNNNDVANSTQPSDMLKMIADQVTSGESRPPHQATAHDLSYPVTSGGIPASYSAGLANSRAEIDRLIKMQAEQDRSVQNLTNLLQPLSPTGAIPGLTGQMPNTSMPQPPLDLDQLFNQDYFTDYASLDNSGIPTSRTSNAQGQPDGVQHPTANDTSDVDELFNFDAMGTPQLDHSYPAVSSSAQGPSPQPASKSPRTR